MDALKSFDYFCPKTVKEATQFLAQFGRRTKVIAGGTDLLIQMRAWQVSPDYLVDLKDIRGIQELSQRSNGALRIGATVDLRTLETDAVVRAGFPVLSEAAALVGSVQIRNLGTVGGNLCNAAPSADMAPALLVLNARAHIAGEAKRRTVPLSDFFLGPGKTVLRQDEVLTAVEVPPPLPRSGASYKRVSTRKAMDIAVVGVAALVALEPGDLVCREARIALGAVAPTPMRVPAAERLLKGQPLNPSLLRQAAALAAAAARPISDVRGSAEYRRQMVEVLTGRALAAALKTAKEAS